MKINLVGGDYSFNACFTGDFADGVVDLQTCINYYPQSAEQGGGQNALIPTSGLALVHDLNAKIRGLQRLANGWIIAIAGSKVWRFKGTEKYEIGSINDTYKVSMAENGKTLIIATWVTLYKVDLSTWTLSQVTPEEPLANGAQFVDFLDGYFLYSFGDTSGRFGWSELYSTDFKPLNFATAEGRPDKIVTLKVLGRELWALGENTTEVYYNSGGANLPFRRISGAFMTYGCEAPYSVAKASNSLIFLAKTTEGGRQIIQTQGYQPKRISTHAIEAKLQNIPTQLIYQASAYCYQEYGHYFYVISFGENFTFVYDLVTGLWHQRAWLSSTKELKAHRGAFFAYDGRNLVSDRENGKIYQITAEAKTDDGRAIYRERTLPAISQDKNRIRHDRFEIEAKTDLTEQASLHLSWSDDYGRTWTTSKGVSMQAREHKQAFAVWRRLGTSKNRAYRISTTSQARVPLIAGYLNTQFG